MNIKEILNNVKEYKRGNEEYYNVVDFQNIVMNLQDCSETEELLLVPFYITEKVTYEIYEYQLYIRMVERPCFDEYMLQMTGKNNVQEIKVEIWNKRKQCDIEVLNNGDSNIISKLKSYLNYLLHNQELENELKQYLGEFDIHNLYYAIY